MKRFRDKNKKQKTKQNSKSKMQSEFDPNGSYTGVTKEKGEKPVQDADDL